MTVAEAFRTSLDALLKAQGKIPADLTRSVGINSATLTRLLSGERGASFDVLERLCVGLEVQPAALFDPDAALARIGLARRSDTKVGESAHGLDRNVTPGAISASPLHADGGAALMTHPDSELLAAVLAYWDQMTPEGRLELVGHGHRLRTAATAAHTAPFRAG